MSARSLRHLGALVALATIGRERASETTIAP
jgi:hypothetical protein